MLFLFVFVFINFIFFRVMTKAIFDNEITVLAAAIISISFMLIMLFCKVILETSTRVRWLFLLSMPHKMVLLFLKVFAIAIPVAIGVAGLVVFGFSERLSVEVFYRYQNSDELAFFAIIFATPIICDGTIFFFSMRQLVRDIFDRSEADAMHRR